MDDEEKKQKVGQSVKLNVVLQNDLKLFLSG